MAPPPTGEVTRLLVAWHDGDQAALDRLIPILYDDLHAIAGRCLRGERSAHTLQATALVSEAYIRLVGTDASWAGRPHFLAIAARTMRRVLVDHARSRSRKKRGGGAVAITLMDVSGGQGHDAIDVIAIDELLERLAAFDERKARAVELHYFGGLEYTEVAQVLGISPATVDRDLRFARSWIRDALTDGSDAR